MNILNCFSTSDIFCGNVLVNIEYIFGTGMQYWLNRLLWIFLFQTYLIIAEKMNKFSSLFPSTFFFFLFLVESPSPLCSLALSSKIDHIYLVLFLGCLYVFAFMPVPYCWLLQLCNTILNQEVYYLWLCS